MRTWSVLLALALLALPVGAFALRANDAPGSVAVPPLREGDRATYEFSDGSIVEVLVEGVRRVRDGDGNVVAAVLLRSSYAAEEGTFEVVDAFAPGTGSVIASFARSCSDCGIMWNVVAAGTPGAFGRAWLSAAASHKEERAGCIVVSREGHPLRGTLFGTWSLGPDGRNATFCADASMPLEFGDGFPARRIAFEAGSGTAFDVAWTPAPPAGPVAPVAPWNGRFPAGMSHRDDPFPFERAWDWAIANDPGFGEFLAAHPEAYLAESSSPGSGSGGFWRPPLRIDLERNTHRNLTLQAADGSRYTLDLVRTEEFVDAHVGLRALAIRDEISVDARRAWAGASMLDPSVPVETVSVDFVTDDFMARVPSVWAGTDVGAWGGRPGEGAYVFRVMSTSDDLSDGASGPFELYAGWYEAATGRLLMAQVPHEFAWG